MELSIVIVVLVEFHDEVEELLLILSLLKRA